MMQGWLAGLDVLVAALQVAAGIACAIALAAAPRLPAEEVERAGMRSSSWPGVPQEGASDGR